MSISAKGLRLLTLNVNGMGGLGKAAALLRYMSANCSNPDIVCLQEVKIADAERLTAILQAGRGAGVPFQGRHYYNPGTDHSCGVAVLVRHNPAFCKLPDAPSAVDSEGRVLRVDFECMQHAVSVMCIYAPNTGRGAFFDSLPAYIPPDRMVLMGGDFNCICNMQDQTSHGTHRLVGSQRLVHLMQSHSLVDAFRLKHPQAREFTHLGTSATSSARLDRWLVNEGCLPWVSRITHEHGAPGDHAGVLLSLLPPDLPAFGPGRWMFPTHILRIECLCADLRKRLSGFIDRLPALETTTGQYNRWLDIKVFLKDSAIAVDKAYRRDQDRQRRVAQSRVQMAVAALAISPDSRTARIELLSANAALKEVTCTCSHRAVEAADAMWQAHGERCTALHFSVGGDHELPAPITQLCDKQGTVYHMHEVRTGVDLHDLVCQHFSSDRPSGLYKVGTTDTAAQDYLLGCIERRVDPGIASAAEGPDGDGSLTVGCMASALAACSNGKSPGRDGLPYEVYKSLWGELCVPLCRAVNDVFRNGCAGEEWAEGIILPFYKGKDLPKDQLASYRPITLLNCDYKLCARVISDRMQFPLEYVVDTCQTAFIKGRWIGDNVLLQQGLAEHLEASQLPGAMVFLDVEKAYDRVDREWLYRCADYLQLPTGMCTWLHRLTDGTRSRVCINGWLTHDFPVDNGLPQGSPLSPPLWVLQLQPFTAALRKAQRIGRLLTPHLPDGTQAPPALHHADDTKLFLRDLEVDGPVAMEIVGKYCLASNAVIHPAKSEGICMGSHTPVFGVNVTTQANFGQLADAPRKALGIPSTTNMSLAAQIVYDKRLTIMRLVARRWSMHPLSAVGRCLNAKQVMANTISYHVTFVPPTAAQVTDMQKILQQYTARSRLPEDATLSNRGVLRVLPKPAIACLPRHLGGISMPDLPNHVIALQAKVIVMCFLPGMQPWKIAMRSALASAAPHPNWGPVWLFTSMRLSLCRNMTSRMHAYVSALRASLPRALAQGDDSPYPLRALLLEPLYCSSRILQANGEPFPAPTHTVSANWPFTLGQLASAADTQLADPQLQALCARLPEEMQQAMQAARSNPELLEEEDDWWCGENTAGTLLVKYSDPASNQVYFFDVLPCGALHLLPADISVVLHGSWSPACVLEVPKPKYRWSPNERASYDMAPLEVRDSHWPLEQRLLGAWDKIFIYPPAWGHGGVPLQLYTTKAARLRLTALAAVSAVSHHDPAYRVGRALRPRLWADPDHPSASNLQSIEQRWQDAVRNNARSDNIGAPPAWTLPRSASQQHARPARGTRVHASQQVAAAAPPLPPPQQTHHPPQQAPVAAAADAIVNTYTAYWKRLWAAPVSNRVRVFAYRLAHASLPCAAMSAYMNNWNVQDAFCPLCTVAGGARRRPLETYSHLFMECLTYRPAVEWLLDFWVAVANKRPPLSAAVIIADDTSAWADAPTGHLAALWMAVRLTVLHSIWAAKISNDREEQSAAAVVRKAIFSLRAEIRLQFNRGALQTSLSGSIPRELLRMHTPISNDRYFVEVWAHSGLCRVDPPSEPDGGSCLVLLLTEAHPVAAPVFDAAVV